MESANAHHHHHQDQLVGSSNALIGISTTWPPSSTFMNTSTTNGFNSHEYLNHHQSMLNSTRPQENYTSNQLILSSHPPYTAFNWPNQQQNFTTNQEHSRIKQLSDLQYYRSSSSRYTDLLSSTCNPTNFQQNEVDDDDEVATKLFLKSGNLINKNNARFSSQIFPTINVSSCFNDTPAALDMNLEAVDLLASSRFNADFINPSNSHTHFRDHSNAFSFGGFDHMQQPPQIINPYYASNKAPSAASCNAAAVEQQQPKRNSNKMEPKALIQNAPKKSRLEARSSCPPFKVRKEKLGDRIAALQQLVAPFGKTDTASVLMEAIGYIKFLQSQVETLSVPYMKASRNKPSRLMKGGLGENEYEESRRDLKSRGLCLVPLTCLSYITEGGGGAVWASPQFGGAT